MSPEQQSAGPESSDDSTATGSNGVPAALLEILVCPVDHASLEGVTGGLRCTRCGSVYEVEGGIPNMVVEDH